MKNSMPIVIIFLCLGLCVFMDGCQGTQKEQSKAEKPNKDVNVSETQASKTMVTTTQENERRIFFADLIKNNQVILGNREYREALYEEPDRWFRNNILHHGKAKSIFHHPVWGEMQNNLVFENISIQGQVQMKYSIGLFTKDCERVSDGVKFKISVSDGNGQSKVLFEETFSTFDTWQDSTLDLSEYSGKTVTIELVTEALEDTLCDWATWGTPRLIFYSVENNSVIKEIESAQRYDSIINDSSLDRNLSQIGTRVDRGWIADAVKTAISLPEIIPNTVIRYELSVVEKSAKQNEVVTIELIDENNNVLHSSKYDVREQKQIIVDEYTVADSDKLPDKIHISLDNEQNASMIFIKEPVQHALRKDDTDQHTPNVILISLDALRADRLGCYGYARNVSPNIDAFAAESVVFRNAYSNSNWTLPSHVSMFTSLYPSQHRVVTQTWHNNQWDAYEPLTIFIPEIFKNQGYLTLAFTGGGFVHSRYGFNKGFDFHVEDVKELNLESLSRFHDLLDTHKNAPFFIFFHTYEIHDYYDDKPMHHQYVGENIFDKDDIHLIYYIKSQAEDVIHDQIKQKLLPENGIQYIRDLYDGAIFYTDDLLGKFFTELKKMDMYDTSWIILTADHGEGFGEIHCNNHITSWHHGFRLYDDQIRVPLIIKPPKSVQLEGKEYRIIEQPAQIIDIPPTLVSILGIEPYAQFEGENLQPFFTTSASVSNRAIFSEDIRNRQFAVIHDDFKLIARTQRQMLLIGDFAYELYDLKNDPLEKINLAHSDKYAPLYNDLKQLLDEHVRDLLQIIGETRVPERVEQQSEDAEVDEKHLQRLKDLGYL